MKDNFILNFVGCGFGLVLLLVFFAFTAGVATNAQTVNNCPFSMASCNQSSVTVDGDGNTTTTTTVNGNRNTTTTEVTSTQRDDVEEGQGLAASGLIVIFLALGWFLFRPRREVYYYVR